MAAKIGRGASREQLDLAARLSAAIVEAEGSRADGWTLRIEPHEKAREFFGNLFNVMVRDVVAATGIRLLP